MNEKLKTILAAVAGCAIVLSFASTHTALADGNPATDQVPRLVPYQGTLEKDGVAVTGQVQMTFGIFDGATSTTPAWTEKLAVNVYSGRFMALLGSTTVASATNLAKAIANADDLYLRVTLNNASGDVALSNRQRFLPTPFAIWATASTNLQATSINAPTGNPLTLNNTTKTEVQVGGNIRLKGYDVTLSPWDSGPRGDGGRALVLDTGDTLAVNFSGDFAGGVRMEGAVKMTGSLTVPTATVSTRLDVGVVAHHCDGGAWDCVCPAGNYTMSGGFMCPDHTSGVMSYPTPDPQYGYMTGWHATCQNTSGTEVQPSTVWVMCARIL